MATDKYISENKTNTFKKGDKVVMYNCLEAEYEGKNKIFTCLTDSFIDKSKDEIVVLEEYSGAFLTKFLKCYDNHRPNQNHSNNFFK